MTTIENVECFVYCDGCECEYNLDDMFISKGIYLCEECDEYERNKDYDCCVNCEDVNLKEDMKVIDGKYCCKGCYKKCKKVKSCDICGNAEYMISLKCRGDSLWCEDCYKEQEEWEREQDRKNRKNKFK